MKKNSFLVLDHFFESISLLKKHKQDLARMSLLPSVFILLELFLPSMGHKILAVILFVLSGFAFYICTCRLFYGKDVGRNFTRLSYKGVFWRTLLSIISAEFFRWAFLGVVVNIFGVVIGSISDCLSYFHDGQINMNGLFFVLSGCIFVVAMLFLEVLLFPMTIAAAVGEGWSSDRVLDLTKGRRWFVFRSLFICLCVCLLGFGGAAGLVILTSFLELHILWVSLLKLLAWGVMILISNWLSAFSMQIYKTLVNQSKESSAKEGSEV